MMRTIEIDRILENAMNPRNFDEALQRSKLTLLIESIRAVGLLSPPVLYRKAATRYYAPLDGHRRIRACRELGIREIPFVWTKDLGLPEAMTDSEALKYMFESQGTTEAWKAKDKLEVIGSAVDDNQDFYVPKRMANMKTVYGLAPGWLRDLMRRGNHSTKNEPMDGIGWSVVQTIFNYTTDEREVRRWVTRYMGRSIPDRHTLRELLRAAYAGKKPA